MTLALALPRRRVAAARETVVDVPVGEGASVRCHYVAPDAGRGTVVVLHGLTGSADAPYVHGVARKVVCSGLGVVRVNARGCGRLFHLAPQLGHAGLSADVVAIMRAFALRRETTRLHLFGFSMGGNIALKAAAESRSDTGIPLCGVVAISPAADLAHCAHVIDTDRRLRFYRDVFVRGLRAALRGLAQHHRTAVDRGALRRIRTLREFDDFYTAPTWGFADAEDYWRRSSSIGVCDRIVVPALVIAARDDLLVPLASLAPIRRSAASDLRFLASAKGGHCSFRAARRGGDPDRHWAENRGLAFLSDLDRDDTRESP